MATTEGHWVFMSVKVKMAS